MDGKLGFAIGSKIETVKSPNLFIFKQGRHFYTALNRIMSMCG